MVGSARRLLALLAVVAMLAATALAATAPPDCVTNVEASKDYFEGFPTTVDKSSGFSVEYFKTYKVVTNGKTGQKFALYLCGTAKPSVSGAKVIQVPVASVAVKNHAVLPALAMLGVSNSVKYVQDLGNVVDPCYIPGSPSELNGDAKYDVVFTSTVDDTDSKAATFSAAAVDAAPLNRAEWLKFVSYFFNKELDAATQYQRMVDQYACRKAQVASADPKPTIAWIEKVSDKVWTISNGAYVRTLLADAGAVPMAARSSVDQSQLLDVLMNSHAVIDATARDGEWSLSSWLKMFGVSSVSEKPYKFVRNRKIYLADRLHSNNGTNAFPTESTQLVNVLQQDLISIFYPPAQHTYAPRFIRNVDDGYTTPSGTCSAADLFPSNVKECDGGAKPDKYTAGSSILTGSDAASSSSSSSGTTQESSTSASSGTPVGTIIVVVILVVGVAAVAVFVAPGMMRKYRERKNQAYMREML